MRGHTTASMGSDLQGGLGHGSYRLGNFRPLDPAQLIFSLPQLKRQLSQPSKLLNYMSEIILHQWNVLYWLISWIGLHEIIYANFDHRDGYIDRLTLRTILFVKGKRCADGHGRKKAHHRSKDGVANIHIQGSGSCVGNHLVIQADRQLTVDETRSEKDELTIGGLPKFAHTKLVGCICEMHSAEAYRPSTESGNHRGRDGDRLVRCDARRPRSDNQEPCREADSHRERQENTVENPLHRFFPPRVIGIMQILQAGWPKALLHTLPLLRSEHLCLADGVQHCVAR